MQIAAKRDKTKKYFILPPLPYDGNSQEVKLIRKTPIIAKVNNSKLKLINNDRYVITKINTKGNEITVTAVRNDETTFKTEKFQKVFDIKEDNFKKSFKVGYVFTKNNDRYIITKINTR
jgi:hypothetical protein